MKKLLAILLLSLPVFAYSQDTSVAPDGAGSYMRMKPVPCAPIQVMVQAIEQKYGEKFVFSMPNDQSRGVTSITMFENKETGTWTMLENTKSVACIIGIGSKDNT